MSTLTLKKPDPIDPVDSQLESMRTLMRVCADELDEALALKIGVMDSESKAAAVNSQRAGAMQAVAARLREAALG